jgi:hypothetical protein
MEEYLFQSWRDETATFRPSEEHRHLELSRERSSPQVVSKGLLNEEQISKWVQKVRQNLYMDVLGQVRLGEKRFEPKPDISRLHLLRARPLMATIPPLLGAQ